MEVTCRPTVSALLVVKKARLVSANTAVRTKRLPSAANFWMRSLRFSFIIGVSAVVGGVRSTRHGLLPGGVLHDLFLAGPSGLEDARDPSLVEDQHPVGQAQH